MKKLVILIFVLVLSFSAFALDKTVVSGNVKNFDSSMRIDFYCSGSYIGYKDIVSIYGNYQKTLPYCSDLEGRLVYSDSVIEVQRGSGEKVKMNFTGIVQTPFFGVIGGVLAVGGVLIRKRFL